MTEDQFTSTEDAERFGDPEGLYILNPDPRFQVLEFIPNGILVPIGTRLHPHEGQGIGIPCAKCGARGCVRVRPRIYWCQAKGCGAWSLVVIGKELSGGKLKTLEYPPEPADEDALKARLAQS